VQSKLTLRIDEHLIIRAKEQARARGMSVSALVAGYLSALGAPEPTEPTSRVRRLRGTLRDTRADRETYRKHLREKHQV